MTTTAPAAPFAPGTRVVVTGGGSAGHVVPALPVVEALARGGCEVHFIGGTGDLERALLEPFDAAYHGVPAGKLRRYPSLRTALDALRVPLGICCAWRLLGRIRPAVAFSKGGYVSFPVVVAAWLRGVPVVAHESDLTPGLANRLALPFVHSVCVNFDETRIGGKPAVATGTPLRDALRRGDAGRGRALLGLAPQREAARPVLLAVGGSLGARRLNAAVRGALDTLLERYVVVHVCGAGMRDATLAGVPGYIQYEYVAEGWGDIIAAADLVVSRAGAGALCEWLALGKAHLLVPLPKTASRGDQIENAAWAQARGYSRVLPDERLDAASLPAALAGLEADAEALRRRMADFETRDAAARIIGQLARAAAGRRRA